MYHYKIGDPFPETDEEALKRLEGYPEYVRSLYTLYRSEEYHLGVAAALKRTLEACIYKTLKAKG